MGKAVKGNLDLGALQEANEPLGPRGRQVAPRTVLAQEETEPTETDPTEPEDDGLKLWQEDDTLPPDQRESALNAERDALVQTVSTHVILNTMISQRYASAGVQPAQVYQGLRDPALTNPEITRILAAAGTSPTQINKSNFQRSLYALEGQYDERQVNELVTRVQSYVNSSTDVVTSQYSQSVQGVVDRMTAAQPNYVGMRPQFSPAPAPGPVAGSYNRRRAFAQAPAVEPLAQPAANPLVQPAADPLSSESFSSVAQLRERLLQFPGEEGRAKLYNKVFDMVGPENEDRAKEALAKFFQGLAGGIFDLYRILQEQGLASPIDEEMVGQIMQTNPELAPKDDKQEKIQGLFLPPQDSGLFTTAEAAGKIEKQAGGSIGGSGNGYNAYVMEGTSRMCPKIRNVVNTFICRYHCLDGLVIDDAQVLCGEALWRQAVMDKYSREYRDADGNWVGGYINKRFEVHHDTGGHPYQLKPGQRHAPIHEDAWNTEKRLQEMRRAESKDRGYCETPGDPKGLYNFDQHDLAKGPTPPDLSGKDKDKLAKNAAGAGETKKAAGEWTGDPAMQDLAKQDPREFGNDDAHEAARGMLDNHRKTGEPLDVDEVRVIVAAGLAKEDDFEMRGGGLYWEVMDVPGDWGTSIDELAGPMASKSGFNFREAKKKGKKKGSPNPWAVCHTTVDKDEDPDKYERCVMDVKEKQSSSDAFNLRQAKSKPGEKPNGDKHNKGKKGKKGKKKAFNLGLSKVATNGGDPMMDHVDHGPRQKQCKKCRKMTSLEARVCDGLISDPMGGPARPCGGADFHTLYEGDVQSMTGGIKSPDLALKASSDAEITCANGVFRAAKDGRWAYGSSPAEAAQRLSAMTKTAQAGQPGDIRHMEMPPMQEMSAEVLNKMNEDKGVQSPAAPEAAPTPAGDAEQRAVPEGLPPVSELLEGESWEDEDHVSANDLDVYLEDEAAGADSEEQAETDIEADALGLGPDPKKTM
jgi:hypothetical protein